MEAKNQRKRVDKFLLLKNARLWRRNARLWRRNARLWRRRMLSKQG
jgi:hypothetical protein